MSAPVRIDPTDLRDLVETVVDGRDPASRRRLEAEQRRRDAEERERASKRRREDMEADRAFVERTLASPIPLQATPSEASAAVPKAKKPAVALAIQFDADEKCAVPRKTRQSWLNKFLIAVGDRFPDDEVTLDDQARILSRERDISVVSRSSASYIGAWMNGIHAMKSAPSLSLFLNPSQPAESSSAEPSAAPSEPCATTAANGVVLPQHDSEQKPSLLGIELPYNLFGSDDEEYDDAAPASSSSPAARGDILPAKPATKDSGAVKALPLLDNEHAHVTSSLTATDTASECTRSAGEAASSTDNNNNGHVPTPLEDYRKRVEFVTEVVASHLHLKHDICDEPSIASITSKVVLKVVGDQSRPKDVTLGRLRAIKAKIDILVDHAQAAMSLQVVRAASDAGPSASSVHGQHPQFLIEKIVRLKIYDLPYWKEQCFALNAETLVDRAVALDCVGGCYGGTRQPSRFLCLLLKMLQISPELDIVLALIDAEDFKYMRLLGAVYLRLTADPLDVYTYLEPLLNDYRKVVLRKDGGELELSHIDQVIDELLTGEHFCNVTLPRLPKRRILEETGKLQPRFSILAKELDEYDNGCNDGE
ncbi:unnamed protein product (mitochondrion) [Plasmodiophora brassicae]|uniref:Pre-mRNA-splicing factor 38 n=2 Tax=Plasmodiophora brassicae TaxID=37360 RepID=A0A3P3YBT3_PLABS|nr:unnamed protein product [Plasmodiophora brassicae]